MTSKPVASFLTDLRRPRTIRPTQQLAAFRVRNLRVGGEGKLGGRMAPAKSANRLLMQRKPLQAICNSSLSSTPSLLSAEHFLSHLEFTRFSGPPSGHHAKPMRNEESARLTPQNRRNRKCLGLRKVLTWVRRYVTLGYSQVPPRQAPY